MTLKFGSKYLITQLLTIFLVPCVAVMLIEAISRLSLQYDYNLGRMVTCFAFIVLSSIFYVMTRPKPVYLVDYACYQPPAHLQAPTQYYLERAKALGNLDETSSEFQRKILVRSGLGEETHLPKALHCIPSQASMVTAREETEQYKCNPQDIGILVVNCSLFDPAPSLSAIIVHKYKLRSDIKSFNLGGMGCSSGVIAVDLAKNLLRVHRNTYVIVMSTENVILSTYSGDNKPMMVTNCLFRVGGAAILLSNKYVDRQQTKYKLVHKSFKCIYQERDESGIVGVSLSKDLTSIAGGALKINITTLGPLVLPIKEQLRFFITMVVKKLFRNPKMKTYSPDFKLAFDHFRIHAGGRGVIDELEKSLQLSSVHVEASRMTLQRLAILKLNLVRVGVHESKGRMHKNNRVWQIAFGSGFKCNSAVWVALKNVKPAS
ncbi:hypothetical protein MKX01_033671 [Papaver californicum]|nr:hypothetical protein MKX01_033671 [Papaver californicum]